MPAIVRSEEIPNPDSAPLLELPAEGSETLIEDYIHDDTETEDSSEESVDESTRSPELLSQDEPTDLIRELDLSKDSPEVLASRLKEKNLLQSITRNNLLSYKRAKVDTVLYPGGKVGVLQ